MKSGRTSEVPLTDVRGSVTLLFAIAGLAASLMLAGCGEKVEANPKLGAPPAGRRDP